jgi:hypothetical protein
VFSGFTFTYSTAMDPATAGSPANYQVSRYVLQRVNRRNTLVPRPVAFDVRYEPAANTVVVLVRGRPNFNRGGQILIVGGPGTGVTSSAGVSLDGDRDGNPGGTAVFNVSPNARAITPA